MRLIVALPSSVAVDVTVEKVGGEGLHGSFTMLPRHLDHVVLLESGIVSYVVESGEQRYVAVDGGVLTKVGDEVRVSTPVAVPGDRLEELERAVTETFGRMDDRERDSRAALARIESHFVHELFELEERA